ncbi:hypothetical protein ACQP1U_08425 [Actinomycetota bacterium]
MRLLITAAVAGLLGLFSSYGVYQAAQPKVEQSSNELFDYGANGQKVTICHKAGNKYNEISVAVAALNGHSKHGDIIPPAGDFAGQNYDAAGQAKLANGCK